MRVDLRMFLRGGLVPWIVGLIIFIIALVDGPATAQTALDYRVKDVLTGETAGHFNQPQGLFYNADSGQLIVADTSNRRLIFYAEEEGTLVVSREIKVDKEVGAPVHFIQTGEGKFILSNPQKRRVQILYPSGALAGPLNLSEVPEGESVMPGDITLDWSNHFYLVDETNLRILIFTEEGSFLRFIKPQDPVLRGLNAVAVDAKSNVYTLDTLGGRVYKFDPDGTLLLSFGGRGPDENQFDFPVALAVDRRGIFVLDQHRGSVSVFDHNGDLKGQLASKGWERGKLLYPTDIVIDEAERLFVADRNNHRVQLFVGEKK